MIRLATIGSSAITDEFLQAIQGSTQLRHQAVYSRTLPAGEAFARKHGVELVFTSLEDLANCEEVDGIYIASPNALHYGQAKYMLEHGKHVLCEKTCVVTTAQLAALLAIANANGLVFLEAIKGMYMPQPQLIQNALPKLGRVYSAKFDFGRQSSAYPAFRAGEKTPNLFRPELAAGGLMDMGVYTVYPAIRFFGFPKRIAASAALHENGIDVAGAQLLEYDGLVCTLTYSKSCASGHDNVIMGDVGTLHIDNISTFQHAWITYQDGSEETICHSNPDVPPMRYEAEAFAAIIEDPLGSREEYCRLQRLTRSVIQAMEIMRESAGIRFSQECYTV